MRSILYILTIIINKDLNELTNVIFAFLEDVGGMKYTIVKSGVSISSRLLRAFVSIF